MKKNTEHRLELYGNSGINIPFLNYNTSGRLVMSTGQDKQVPIIKNPEEAIVDTGFSKQINQFTFDVKIENTSIVLGVVKKYNNRYDGWSNDEWSSLLVFCHDTVTSQLVHYEVCKYRMMDNKFGFAYTIDEELIFNLKPRDVLEADTRLSWSNSTEGNAYKKGKNLNTFIGSIPELGEDAILMDEDIIKDFTINTYTVYEVSYGKSAILANVHGDDKTYKAYLDIGDTFEPGDVLYSKIECDLRDLKTGDDFTLVNNAMLFSNGGLRTRRPHFTNNVIMKSYGRVVDIDIVYNPKSGENIESETMGRQTAKYLMMLSTYHQNILKIYEMYKKGYESLSANISDETNNLIVQSMIFLETDIKGKKPNIMKEKKRSKLDMYTLRITTEQTIVPNNSYKFSDRYGGQF